MLMKISCRIDLRSIAICEISETVGESIRFGHAGAVYQDRNDWNRPPERRLHFDSNRIRFFFDAIASALARAEPLRTNNDNQNVGMRQNAFYVVAEIIPNGILSMSINTDPLP